MIWKIALALITGMLMSAPLGYSYHVAAIELKGSNTKEFLAGYIIGAGTYWDNRGYAEGYGNMSISSPS
jgi:hypothetical protein